MELQWWHYFVIFHISWGLVICRTLHQIFNGGLDYILKEDQDYAKKFEPFRRKDINQWNKIEVYIGAIFLLPYRLVVTIACTLTCAFFCKLLTYGVNLEKEISPLRRMMVRFWTYICPRIIIYMAGIYYIEKHVHNIRDFDPTYPIESANKKVPYGAPIIVSNHISFADIFYFLTNRQYPCFLSKAEVAKVPMVGAIAKVRQSVFVAREERSQKDAVMDMIKTRIENIKAGKIFPPMIIFPEGTTTNGEAIITFKKGAFSSFAPVRIYCIEYPKKSFSPSYDSLKLPITLILLYSQFYNRIKVHDCGIYNPDHLNLKEEGDWEKYAAKVREIMCKCLNVPAVDISFREKQEYYNYGRELGKSKPKDD